MANPNVILRNFRLSKGLSCAELARILGIAEPTARSLENGHRKVTAEMAVLMERAIGIPRHELRPDLYKESA